MLKVRILNQSEERSVESSISYTNQGCVEPFLLFSCLMRWFTDRELRYWSRSSVHAWMSLSCGPVLSKRDAGLDLELAWSRRRAEMRATRQFGQSCRIGCDTKIAAVSVILTSIDPRVYQGSIERYFVSLPSKCLLPA